MRYYKEVERTDKCSMWCNQSSTTNEGSYLFLRFTIGESSDLSPTLKMIIVKDILNAEYCYLI